MNPIEQIVYQLHAQNMWEKDIVLSRNEFLKVKGSADSTVYFVEEGTLRLFVEDEHEEHTIRFAYKHNLITALDAFITGLPSELYIQALKKTTLKAICKNRFVKFVADNAELSGLWVTVLEQLILQQMERERDLLTASPVERYKRVLQRSPQLFQEVPHKYIASYLRMKPETLSRINHANL